MSTPICQCGKRGTPFKWEWHDYDGDVNSTMEGWRCKKCGRWGLLWLPPTLPQEIVAREAEYERLRLEGIKFDEELERHCQMSIQTEAMREIAGDQQYITAGQHKETLEWHGILMFNHPTPSGCDRWMMGYSDKRGWPDAATSIAEFAKLPSMENIKQVPVT